MEISQSTMIGNDLREIQSDLHASETLSKEVSERLSSTQDDPGAKQV